MSAVARRVESPIIGDSHDPLLIRVLSAEDPQFYTAITGLRSQGHSLSFSRAIRTPAEVVAAFDTVRNAASEGRQVANSKKGNKGDVSVLAAQAIIETGTLARGQEDTELQPEFITVNKGLQNLTTVQADGEASSPQLDYINSKIWNERSVKQYADHRLKWDMTDQQSHNINEIIGVAALACTGGLAIQNFLIPHMSGFPLTVAEGGILFLTGQLDDLLGAAGTFRTERGGGKSLKQIARENVLTLGAMGVAGVIDWGLLPHMFDQTGFGWHLAAGATFAFTCFAGSITSKISNISRNAKTIRSLNSDGLLPGNNGKVEEIGRLRSWKLGFDENQSNPYRVGLLWGIGASASIALLAAGTGILSGHSFSPALQAGLGPLETATAIISAKGAGEKIDQYFANKRVDKSLRTRLQEATLKQ